MSSVWNDEAIGQIVAAVLAVWPEHERYIRGSFASRSSALMASSEMCARRVLRVAKHNALPLERLCSDYRFLCGVVLEEELHFRRTGAYRLSKFEDALRTVYSDREFMDRYMNFLLLSHVLWSNHAQAIHHFEHVYLAGLQTSTRHLEIGPGHGLLLSCAAEHPLVVETVGWDVSEASIEQTRRCLASLGTPRPTRLVLQNLFDAPDSAERFDSVVLAEVLEHLEDPVAALRSVRQHMAPGARLWVHVPINSPAPDHLYLLRSPGEARHLLEAGGFRVVEAQSFPMSGVTLERALKQQLTISAVMTAELAA
ncbi:MAG: class I SAM-dependent methyltransferase [Gammaproteobacteria bacterium]|nr:class I SAM-dependent methyltransferase [Gammaproteobacteria bacterium]